MQLFKAAKAAKFAALSLSILSAGAAQAGYVIQDIVDPVNPGFTQALGINNAGTVVGYGNAANFNGFVIAPPAGTGSLSRQNFPGSSGTQVVGVSGSGTTVGFWVDGVGGNHGYVQSNGTFTSVDQPGTAFNQLLGIDRTGSTAAGYASVDPTGATGQQAEVVTLASMTFTNINGLLPANLNSQATGVNDAGTVVGFYQTDAAGDFSAFQDQAGLILSLVFPSAKSTQALGINDLGQIVGDYLDASGAMHGFVYASGQFQTLDPAGSTGAAANGINDLGQIVGFYSTANGNTVGFLASPTSVPEPGSLLLAGVGLAAALAARRRRG